MLLILAIVFSHAQAQEITIINYHDFTVGFNDKLKLPEWVTYRLTAEMIEAEKDGERSSYYWQKGSLKPSDYSKSGYDRSHMAPYGALNYDAQSAKETFSMINIMPQTPFINRGIWKHLETYEGKLAMKEGCVLVHIRNHFDGRKKEKLHIPEYHIKTIYGCDLQVIGEFKVFNIY